MRLLGELPAGLLRSGAFAVGASRPQHLELATQRLKKQGAAAVLSPQVGVSNKEHAAAAAAAGIEHVVLASDSRRYR